MPYSNRAENPRHVTQTPDSTRSDALLETHRRTLSASGQRGELKFVLKRVVRGLYVEREDVARSGFRSLQALRFSTADDFRQWCDNDPVRFEYPTLHLDVKRQGDELWRLAVDVSNNVHDNGTTRGKDASTPKRP